MGGFMQFDVKDGTQPYCNDWFRNSQVTHTGKEAYHTMFQAYPSEEAAKRGETPWEYSLDGEWKFFYSRDIGADIRKMTGEGFCDEEWQTVHVPSCWQDRRIGAEDPLYVNIKTPFYEKKSEICPPSVPDAANSMGVYRRHFSVPQAFRGRHTMLYMEGVESAVNVWVNGYFVGFSQGSFSPVEFDISRYLHEGDNLLCCQVYRYSAASFLEDQDMWRLAGIFRSVRLISRPEVGLFDFQIRTELDQDKKDASLKLMAVVRNRSDDMQEPRILKACLEAPDGSLLPDTMAEGFTGMENPDWPANSWRGMPSFSKPIFANSIRSIYLNIPVSSPQKWTAETPTLYHIHLTLMTEEGTVTEVIRWPVGFRQIEVKDGRFCVNGSPVILKGVNYHEFSPVNLRAVTGEEMERDIRMMKQNHINAVRSAHYPHSKTFYELCDRYGLYVMDEADMESHDISYKDDVLPGNDMRYTNACLDRISAMVLTNQNYPSVVIWSLGNEMGYGKNVEFMAAYCRAMDGTRLIHKRQMSVVADMDSDTYPSVEWIEKRALANPAKPFLMNEYAHAMGNAMGNLQEYQDVIRRYPALAGGFIWEWCDHGILDKTKENIPIFAYGSDYPAVYQDENFCIDGVVLPDRRETAKLSEVKAVYRPIQAELLNRETGLIRIYNEYSHISLDAFWLEWSLERNDTVVRSGRRGDLDAKAGESQDILLDLNLDGAQAGGESGYSVCLLNLKWIHKEIPAWAEPGFVDTWIQLELGQGISWKKPEPGESDSARREKEPLAVREEKERLSFESGRVSAEISKSSGFFTKLEYKRGEETQRILGEGDADAFRLQIFRAPTDNDRHSPLAMGPNGWMSLGLDRMEHVCRVCQVIQREEESAAVRIHHTYLCREKDGTGFHQYMLLRIWSDGHVGVEQTVQPFGKLGVLPRMGVRIPLDRSLARTDYFGLGPRESYPDRSSGARLGRFLGTVGEMGEPYIRPQENGSRGQSAYVSLTDESGHGILVTGDRPFAFSALSYSAEQLSRVRHGSELDEEAHIYLSVDWRRNGLGNSSCGTDVMEAYRLYPTESRFGMELMPYEAGVDPFTHVGCRMEAGAAERAFSIDHTISLHPEQMEKQAPFDPSDFIERLKAGFRQ